MTDVPKGNVQYTVLNKLVKGLTLINPTKVRNRL